LFYFFLVGEEATVRERMVVTDVTRMQGDRVCVGGYLEDGTAIRPVCGDLGPTEAWLQPAQDEHVVPFSVVELSVGDPPSIVPPHTEDRRVPTTGHRIVQVLPDADRLHWLSRTESPSVRAIFGAEVLSAPEPNQRWGRFVRFGEGSGEEFQLAVVDLAFRRRIDELRDAGIAPNPAASRTLKELRQQRVYLRIGLARGWNRHPDRCYLQITGVYGFD
jgi:hypothetical protein